MSRKVSIQQMRYRSSILVIKSVNRSVNRTSRNACKTYSKFLVHSALRKPFCCR